MDKEVHLSENPQFMNQDNVPMKAKDNEDGTYSLPVSLTG